MYTVAFISLHCNVFVLLFHPQTVFVVGGIRFNVVRPYIRPSTRNRFVIAGVSDKHC